MPHNVLTMEEVAQLQANNSSNINSKHGSLLIWVILSLFLGIIIGVLGGFFAKEIITNKTATDLPIGLELLKNPIVNQWRGAVEGELVEKTNDYIVINDEKGNSISIPLGEVPGRGKNAIFFDLKKSKNQISLDEIPVGTKLLGDFFVIPGVNSTSIIGSTFSVR